MESTKNIQKYALGGAAALAAAAGLYMMYNQTKAPQTQLFTDSEEEGLKNLTRAEANARAAMISDVEYQLAVCLRKGGKTYLGAIDMYFQVNASGKLFIDFNGKQVTNLIVNGVVVSASTDCFKGHRI